MRSWFVSGVAAAFLVMPLGAAAATFNVIFSGAAPLPSGTITFANVGDLAPTSFSFSDGISVWTSADSITGAWATLWSGSLPVDFQGAGGSLLSIFDTVAPNASGGDLRFIEAGLSLAGPSYNSVAPGAFSYAVVVPEPTTFSLVALGVLALGLGRRRTAAR